MSDKLTIDELEELAKNCKNGMLSSKYISALIRSPELVLHLIDVTRKAGIFVDPGRQPEDVSALVAFENLKKKVFGRE